MCTHLVLKFVGRCTSGDLAVQGVFVVLSMRVHSRCPPFGVHRWLRLQFRFFWRAAVQGRRPQCRSPFIGVHRRSSDLTTPGANKHKYLRAAWSFPVFRETNLYARASKTHVLCTSPTCKPLQTYSVDTRLAPCRLYFLSDPRGSQSKGEEAANGDAGWLWS